MKDFKARVFQDERKSVTVFYGLCKGCGFCTQKCPVKAIKFSEKDLGIYYLPTVEVDIKKCIACGLCELTCPDCALRVEKV